MIIRRADQSDSPIIAEIQVRSWRWAYRNQLPESLLDGLSVEERQSKLCAMMSTEEAVRVWLAEPAGHAVGFAATGPGRDGDCAAETAELYAIYLEQDVQRTGVGRALLGHAMNDLRERGFKEALLWVLESNTLARRFYERAGWRADGATKIDHRQEFDLHEIRYTIHC